MFYSTLPAIVNKHLVIAGLSNILDLTIALFTDYAGGETNDFSDALKAMEPDSKLAQAVNTPSLLLPKPQPKTLRDVTLAELVALAQSFQSKDAITASSTRQVLNELFVRLALEDMADYSTKAQGTPLWEKLGWQAYSFQEGELPDPGQLMNAKNDAGELIGREQYEVLFRTACQAKGVPTDSFPLTEMAIGKGDMAVWPVEGSVQIDLGQRDHYRVSDFVKGVTYATYTLPFNHPNLRFQKGKDRAGDGIVGRVRPETIGYERELNGQKTALQMRGFVFDPKNPRRVFAVYKGLLEVDPACPVDKQFFLPEAGYGHIDEVKESLGNSLVIETLCDIVDYSPKGRVSLQARYYEGHPSWKKRFQAAMSVKLSGLKDWERLILAQAGLMFLPVDAYISILRGAASQMVSYDQGVRRKVLPGMDLKPFTFRAPYEMRGLFAVGKQYVIHRDPATPDGMAAFSATCVGYVRTNAFEVPTNVSSYTRTFLKSTVDDNGKTVWDVFGCWEQGGGDFDGDDALVTPHYKQGGLLLGFNDRSPEAQAALIAAAGRGGRKGAGFEKLYPSGFARWMWQRWAAIELGLLDFRARKLIDKHGNEGRLMAAELKPLIQTAVDRQKRDLDYPRPLSELSRLSGVFATKIFSFLRKPDSDLTADKQSWKHSWDIVTLMAEHARKIVAGSTDEELFMPSELHAGVAPVAQWFVSLYETICCVTGTPAQPKHYPTGNRLPLGDIQRFRQEALASLTATGPELGLNVSAIQQDVAALDAELVKLRRSNPTAARAVEALVTEWVSARTPEEREVYAVCFGDARSFIKFASDAQLAQVFAMTEVKVRAQSLPGVTIAAPGAAWKYMKQDNLFVAQQAMTVAGLSCESGQVHLRPHKLKDGAPVTDLLIQGTQVARVAGTVNLKTAGEFMRELAAKVGLTVPTEAEFSLLASYQPLPEADMVKACTPLAEPQPEVVAPVIQSDRDFDLISDPYQVTDAEPIWDEPMYA